MPRKLTAAEHLQSYRVDVSTGKVESGARRRIPYGDGLYLFITGPRSCRWPCTPYSDHPGSFRLVRSRRPR